MNVEQKRIDKSKMNSNYKLKVKPIQIVEFPGVGNLLYDELGKLVLRKLNERFRRVLYILKKDQIKN